MYAMLWEGSKLSDRKGFCGKGGFFCSGKGGFCFIVAVAGV